MGVKGIVMFEGPYKTCRTCQVTKPLEEFRWRTDGKAHRPNCDKCLRDRGNASEAGYRARLKHMLGKYGLTPESYADMLHRQDGRCAICGSPGKAYGRLYVDHCHETGQVRGLLCNTCNAGLGQFGDSLELLEKATEYIRKGGVS